MMEYHRGAMDWEWRLVASDRERRRAVEKGRRRRRRRLLLGSLLLAVALSSAVLAATALSLPTPYARAALAAVAGDLRGAVSVEASRSDNEVVSDAAGTVGATSATWATGTSGAYSHVVDGALISTGTVSLTDVSLLGGLVTAKSIDLVANAAATRDAVSGGVDVSRVEGLRVDGRDVAMSELPMIIQGVGTLGALERRVTEEGGVLEAEVIGLRLRLSDGWRGMPEGAEIVVAVAAACADKATANRLLPRSLPQPAQGGSAGGSSGGTPDDSSDGSSGESSGGSAGGGSGGYGGTSAGSFEAESFRPGRMPAPGKATPGLLSFPGAVFPVAGKVWYGNDFAVVRPPGVRHGACDVFARKGTPVLAVQSGVVTEIRYRSLGGNSFHLTNERGDYFYYAHLLRYAGGIEEGTPVTAGQVIGYVGNTGNAVTTPPHLHFEIHPDGGEPINPFAYLELWRGAATDPSAAEAAGADLAGDAPPSRESAGVTWADSQARHERAVTVAGAAPRPLTSPSGDRALVPAALSFGVLGGLAVSAVRRRRTEFCVLAMDAEDLRRCTDSVNQRKGDRF